MQRFSDEEKARLVSDPRKALANSAAQDKVSLAEVTGLASVMPAAARTRLRMHGQHRGTLERLEAMALRLGADRDGPLAYSPQSARHRVLHFDGLVVRGRDTGDVGLHRAPCRR